MSLKASIIIPTLNRASLLDVTLKSISFQTVSQEEFEIIVIDNGSSDNTKMVCERWAQTFRNFRYIYDDRPGLHIGRNRGYLESRSEILIYGDDDIEVPSSWIQTIIDGFDDEKTVLIGGSDIPNFEETPPDFINNLWTKDYEGNRLLLPFSCIDLGNVPKEISPYYVFGCNFAVRKKIVEAAEGFHPDGVPKKLLAYRGDGESYIAQYIIEHGLKTMFFPGASVKHLVSKNRMTHEYINGIAYRNGVSDMFTMLRKKSFAYCVAKYVLCSFRQTLKKEKTDWNRNLSKGQLFLLRRYLFSKKVRNWVHLKNYLDAVAGK